MPLGRRCILLTSGQEPTIKNLKTVSEGETKKYRRVNSMEEEGSIEEKDVKQRKMSRGKENERGVRKRTPICPRKRKPKGNFTVCECVWESESNTQIHTSPCEQLKINDLRLLSLGRCWALLAWICLTADPPAKMPCHIITLGVEGMITQKPAIRRTVFYCLSFHQHCSACLSIWDVKRDPRAMASSETNRKKKIIKKHKSQINHSSYLQCSFHSSEKELAKGTSSHPLPHPSPPSRFGWCNRYKWHMEQKISSSCYVPLVNWQSLSEVSCFFSPCLLALNTKIIKNTKLYLWKWRLIVTDLQIIILPSMCSDSSTDCLSIFAHDRFVFFTTRNFAVLDHLLRCHQPWGGSCYQQKMSW